MAIDNQDPEYLLGATKQEVERLQKQHAWIKRAINGKIVFAPVDLQKPDLKILDVGCADGEYATQYDGPLEEKVPTLMGV